MDRQKTFKNVTVRVPSPGQVAEWDCRTGERFAIASQSKNGATEWTTDFSPVGEHVFVLSRQPEPGLAAKPRFEELRRQPISEPLAYRLGEPNVCVLDLAQYRVNDGPWQEETEILKVDRAVRKEFGLALRGGEMVQPWFRKKQGTSSEVKGKVALRFQFQVEELPQGPVLLGIEQPASFQIVVNGQAIDSHSAQGWWVDPAIETLPIPAAAFRKGVNTVELAGDFRDEVDLEALYLLGTFGVRLDGTKKTLTKLPEKVVPSDLAVQGFPFYSGPITYRIPIPAKTGDESRLFLETPKFEAACLQVRNGDRPARIAWQPYRLEISDGVVHDGMLELEVILTRRNSFGPLHQVPKRMGGYGPGNWITEGAAWAQEYQLYPSGLLAPPVLCFGRAAK